MTVLRAIVFTGVAWGVAFGATWVVVTGLGEGVR
jgi:hypothetical protein